MLNGNAVPELLERLLASQGEMVARLEAVEQKLNAITTPPKALRIEEAEQHLPLKRAAIKAMIRGGEIATVKIGKRRYIPLTEIIRLTTVREAPRSVPGLSNSAQRAAKKRRGGVPEHEKIRALLKKR